MATIASVGNLAPSSACSVASKGSTSSMGKSLIGRFMHFVATCVSMLTGAHTPQGFASVATLLAAPAVVHQHNHGNAMSAKVADQYSFEWIADSGAGRDLTSHRALIEQGVPNAVIQKQTQSVSPIKFETGNGTVVSDSCIEIPGDVFGEARFQVMDDCPMVRSLGKLVEQGHPFIWCPGELPFFGKSAGSIQLTHSSDIIRAQRVEDSVPIFTETFNMSSAYALPGAAGEDVEHSAPAVVPEAREERVREEGGSSDADSEGEMPVDRLRRLVAEANSLEHKLCHYPKNPHCPVCQRSRMYRKKVRRFRHDAITDRGMLPAVTQFGERIATDFVIVQKLSSGKEHVVQVVRDEFSGWIREQARHLIRGRQHTVVSRAILRPTLHNGKIRSSR